MKQLPLSARFFVASVIVVGAALLVLCLPAASFKQLPLFLTLITVSVLSAGLKISLPLSAGKSTMSVSYTLDFASILLIGPHETMLIAAASAFSQCHLNRKERNPLHRTLFSMATLVIAVEVAGLAFRTLQGPEADPITAVAKPLVGAAFMYFMVNTGLVAIAMALTSQENAATFWFRNFVWSGPSYLVGAATAVMTAWAVRNVGFWAAPLTLAPVYLTYLTYKGYMGRLEAQRNVQETSNLHLATIEALAGAIDAKDQMTNSHILRVQYYANRLAQVVGLPERDLQAVRTAALLHDIGKLAVPEHILSKPGPLTPEEFQKVRIHPQVGSEIIAGVPFPYPVAPLILNHHERWDGKGYPHGRAGEEIPIGARILTIVDYYDAVTSERPYHAALSSEAAVNLLKHEAGRALDPALVNVFVERLPEFTAGCLAAYPPSTKPRALELLGDAEPPRDDPRAAAFENIGLAHREIYALYEIAQAMGTSLGIADTMALISSKLTKIIPWSGCALYLQQEDAHVLRCRYATGVDAPQLLDTTIRVGEGLSGWVARNKRTLVNASPRAEFDAAGLSGDLSVQSAIVCPLRLGDRFIGSLALFHTDSNRYTDDHRRLIGSVAEQAGAVIHNSIAFEQAQEDSLTDPLTALPNRRSLFARLTHELARAERLKSELAIIVLDIDEFKRINDTYGHHVGDDALREMASALRESLRQDDLCVRFAGDEFIVVITDAGRDTAEAKLQELQARIGAIAVEVFPGRKIGLTASAGASVFPHDGRTREELLAEADRRMYRDKSARRDTAQRPEDDWSAATSLTGPVTTPYVGAGIRYE